jgi:methionyl-tRNA synthetase
MEQYHMKIIAGILIVLMIIWSLIWKGFALWKSARNGQTAWFIIFMTINTIGLLEIGYLIMMKEARDRERGITLR